MILRMVRKLYAIKHWTSVAKYFLDLSYKTRNEGILALENCVSKKRRCIIGRNGKRLFSNLESRIFYEGFCMILQGTCTENVRKNLEDMVENAYAGRIENVALKIGIEGIIGVQVADNPLCIKQKLDTIVGVQTFGLIQKNFVPNKKSHTLAFSESVGK